MSIDKKAVEESLMYIDAWEVCKHLNAEEELDILSEWGDMYDKEWLKNEITELQETINKQNEQP